MHTGPLGDKTLGEQGGHTGEVSEEMTLETGVVHSDSEATESVAEAGPSRLERSWGLLI